MQLSKLPLALFSAGALLAAACTDDITLDSPFEEAQLVIDAWVTNGAGTQTINLTETQDYFNSGITPAVTGAQVSVCQTSIGSTCFTFLETSPGVYTWTPSAGESIGEIGERFSLSVEVNGELYTATSALNRVPPIDSISFQFEEQQLGVDEGVYAQVYAVDFPGVGDRYLIRSTINDTLLNRPQELNVAFDAAFDGGTAGDGLLFILPIRVGINKLDDDGLAIPLDTGDVVEVEIWSLEAAPYDFLTNAQEQILNGDSQLFSVPVVSTRGNVTNTTTGERALGVFSVSGVSTAIDTLQ